MTGEHEVDALVADRYLDALLAAVDRHASDGASAACRSTAASSASR